jgi:hypothetical protein
VRRHRPAGHYVVEPGTELRVVVEAEDGVGFGQRRGEVSAVPLRQAAHGDDFRRGVRRCQHGVDRVLLRALDETAGVDHHGIGRFAAGNEGPPVRGQSPGQLLGVHVVARAAEGDQRDSVGRSRARRAGG